MSPRGLDQIAHHPSGCPAGSRRFDVRPDRILQLPGAAVGAISQKVRPHPLRRRTQPAKLPRQGGRADLRPVSPHFGAGVRLPCPCAFREDVRRVNPRLPPRTSVSSQQFSAFRCPQRHPQRRALTKPVAHRPVHKIRGRRLVRGWLSRGRPRSRGCPSCVHLLSSGSTSAACTPSPSRQSRTSSRVRRRSSRPSA
jgi:hypothetical protein